ncbi:hypothetical protein L1887_59228 [Cichorium endivia]|nr:hypothetical protein L1887_59228 [Cichorium endivia]
MEGGARWPELARRQRPERDRWHGGYRGRRGARSYGAATVGHVDHTSGLRRSRAQRGRTAFNIGTGASRRTDRAPCDGFLGSDAAGAELFGDLCCHGAGWGVDGAGGREGGRRGGSEAKRRRTGTRVDRECGGAESERGRGILGRHDLDLGVVLDDGLDGIVEDARDGNVGGFLRGHDVGGIAVLDVALENAGRARSVGGCARTDGQGDAMRPGCAGAVRLGGDVPAGGSGCRGGGFEWVSGSRWRCATRWLGATPAPMIGFARSEAGEARWDEGDAGGSKAVRCSWGASWRRSGAARQVPSRKRRAVEAGVEAGAGSGAGGCAKRRETLDASAGSEGRPLAAGRAPMAAAAVTASIMELGEWTACDGWRSDVDVLAASALESSHETMERGELPGAARRR